MRAFEQEVLVVGAGMVAHRFIESVLSRVDAATRLTVIGEESRAPYDRVALTSYFTGTDPTALALDPAGFDDPRVRFMAGERVVSIHPDLRTVRTDRGAEHAYDALVLATGSSAARPDVPGSASAGCFVYRTLDDVQA